MLLCKEKAHHSGLTWQPVSCHSHQSSTWSWDAPIRRSLARGTVSHHCRLELLSSHCASPCPCVSASVCVYGVYSPLSAERCKGKYDHTESEYLSYKPDISTGMTLKSDVCVRSSSPTSRVKNLKRQHLCEWYESCSFIHIVVFCFQVNPDSEPR